MIEKVILTNFKSHRSRVVKFDPGVTTIVGPSDAGKSAIVQALRWAVQNVPSGDAFQRHGEPKVEVDVFVDGRHVQRRKGAGGNCYELDGEVYKSFGAGVPDPIAALFNMQDVNFQSQFDMPFWFTESPGQVSRNLNRIVNLTIIDSTLSYIAGRVRTAKAEHEVVTRQLEFARYNKRSLSWVVDLEGRVAELEEMDAGLTAIRTRIEKFQNSVELANSARLRIEKLKNVGSRFQKVKILRAELVNTINRRTHHEALVRSAVVARDAISKPRPDFTRVMGLRAAADAVAERRRIREICVSNAVAARDRIRELDEELKSWREKLEKLRPKICPACGQVIVSSPPSETSTSPSTHPCSAPRNPIGLKRRPGSGNR